MQVTYVSIDEQNHQYTVGLRNGEQFHGRNAVFKIKLRKSPITNKIEPFIDVYGRRELRIAKKRGGKK